MKAESSGEFCVCKTRVSVGRHIAIIHDETCWYTRALTNASTTVKSLDIERGVLFFNVCGCIALLTGIIARIEILLWIVFACWTTMTLVSWICQRVQQTLERYRSES